MVEGKSNGNINDIDVNSMEDKKRMIEDLYSNVNNLESDFYELEYLYNNNRSIIQRLNSKISWLYIFLMNKMNIKGTIRDIRGYRSIKKNNLFDIGYYLKNNQDVMSTGKDPLLHYLYHGYKEDRNPNPNFDTNKYLKTYDEVKKLNINPLIHYSLYGKEEGRKTKNYNVSVIMPTYNRKNVIENAINSVLNQTYNDYELIIIDDGSTDNTEDLIKQKYANYLKYGKIKYFCQKNGGVSNARNNGLKEAEGNIITYLDSDNTWYDKYLYKIVSALSNPYINTVYTAIEVNNIYENKFYVRATPYDRTLLLKGNFIDLNIFAHKKYIYDKLGGFDESLSRLVDWDLILRYTRLNPPYFINEILAKYFIDSELNNISLNSTLEENRLKVQKLHSGELIELGLLNPEK
jgi:hypothetical protein